MLFKANQPIWHTVESHGTFTYILHLSKRNFHFIAVLWSSVKRENSSVCNIDDIHDNEMWKCY